MNAQLITSIIGALIILSGFLTYKFGRTSDSHTTRVAALPVFTALSVVGLAAMFLPIIESFHR